LLTLAECFCLSVVKGPIIEVLEKYRDAELADYREKRKKAAEERANSKKEETKDESKVSN